MDMHMIGPSYRPNPNLSSFIVPMSNEAPTLVRTALIVIFNIHHPQKADAPALKAFIEIAAGQPC